MNFDDFLKTNGISASMYSSYNPDVQNAIKTSFTNQAVIKGPDNQTGLAGIMNSVGIMDDKGQLFGISKDGWNGAGAAFGIGKGVFDIMSANKNYGLAKRYYEHQMGLQNEQAKMARDEYNRINTARNNLNSSYMEK